MKNRFHFQPIAIFDSLTEITFETIFSFGHHGNGHPEFDRSFQNPVMKSQFDNVRYLSSFDPFSKLDPLSSFDTI
jgi:hypothetical protein